MFKSNNHTVGFLNSQYRNILKKCMIFNAFAIMSYIGNANALIPTDQWTINPNTLTIQNAETMYGDYSDDNTLENKHFILLENVLSIQGDGATANSPRDPVIIANKTVNVLSNVEEFKGGFIYTDQRIDENSNANTILFGNSDIRDNQVLGEYNGTTSDLEIKGGFITLGSRDNRNQAPEHTDHWGILVESNINNFSNNEIVITDTSSNSSEDNTVRASGGLFYIMGSAKIDGGSSQGALISNNKVEVIDNST